MENVIDEVEGFMDGLVNGAFCRVFWTWRSDEPDANRVRVRIAGVTHEDVVPMVEVHGALLDAADQQAPCLIMVAGYPVHIPAPYVQCHLDCIAGLTGGLV